MKKKSIFLVVLAVLFLQSCRDLYDFDEPWKKISDAEYAIPLINSTVTLESVFSENDTTIGIRYEDDGLAVITYRSDVIKRQAYQIFKPVVFPGSLYFQDSLLRLRFDQIDNYVVQKGTIRGDSIRYGFTSTFNEPIQIKVTIPEAFNAGGIFSKTFTIQPNSSIISPLFSLRGYDFVSPNNYLTFSYDARRSNGQRVLLDNAYFEFTYFLFDFAQGYLGQNTQKLNEHEISVNIFKEWESGLLEFADPKVYVRMDNSFGFPVKAIVNNFEITQLGGQKVNLVSSVFDNDIYFEYPKLNEIGKVKSTEFYFDKNNSNFATAFNQKLIKVSYDLDAIVNPANDPDFIGFFTFDSYYLLNIGVDLPLIFKANNLKLTQSIEFENPVNNLKEVGEFEIKAYITNLFPIDAYVQLLFADNNGIVIDSLFAAGEKHFQAAIVHTDGSVTPAGITEPIFIKFGADKKNILSGSNKVLAKIRLSTPGYPDQWTRITKNMGLDIKMGVRFDLNFNP